MNHEVARIVMAIEHRPHSFDFIRKATGLILTDAEFMAAIRNNRSRFSLVRFLTRDGGGKPIRPGRPGIRRRIKFVPV